jgi:hypothetical protein
MKKLVLVLCISSLVVFGSCTNGMMSHIDDSVSSGSENRSVQTTSAFIVAPILSLSESNAWITYNPLMTGNANVVYDTVKKTFSATLTSSNTNSSSTIQGRLTTSGKYSISGSLPTTQDWKILTELQVIKYDSLTKKCYLIGKQGRYWDGLHYTDYYVGLMFKLEPSVVKVYSFTPGDEIFLRCEGTVAGPRWLNGLTTKNNVNLSSSLGGIYTGTKWKIFSGTTAGSYYLQTQGHLSGNTFLQAKPDIKDVCLAVSSGIDGTQWLLSPLGNGGYTLLSSSSLSGNKYLDGGTNDGTVNLAPTYGGYYSGAIWTIWKDQ